MSKGVVVYGFSDDLIEVEGYINEEFYSQYGEMDYLAFSDGTLLGIDYNNRGQWKITVEASPGEVIIEPGGETEGNYPDYSDVATVVTVGDLKWVALASQFASERET